MDENSPVDPGVLARDRAAMERLQQGDRTALSVLVYAYQAWLFRYIDGLVHHRQDAEDILQDVWQSVLNHAPTFNLDKSVLPWLFGCAYHRAVDRLRRLVRRREVGHSESAEAGQHNADLRLDCIEAIKKLKPRHRAVAWLLLIREFTPKAIARKLHRPDGTVGRLVSELKQQLQALMVSWQAC